VRRLGHRSHCSQKEAQLRMVASYSPHRHHGETATLFNHPTSQSPSRHLISSPSTCSSPFAITLTTSIRTRSASRRSTPIKHRSGTSSRNQPLRARDPKHDNSSISQLLPIRRLGCVVLRQSKTFSYLLRAIRLSMRAIHRFPAPPRTPILWVRNLTLCLNQCKLQHRGARPCRHPACRPTGKPRKTSGMQNLIRRLFTLPDSFRSVGA
jgi:hypothetical protein